MRSLTALIACFWVLASQTSAHYIFNQFSSAGIKYPVYQYIRQNTNMNSPVIDLTSTDLRCNQGGVTGGNTQTITIAAGSSFTFTSDTAVYHNGPLSIYMAKATSTAAAFDGAGSVWFKILDLGPTFSNGAATWPLAQDYSYTVPTALPSGDYLLRIQQLAIHNPYPAGIPQFYVECAQVTVTGGGSGAPGPLESIPGFIKGDEPGYTANIYANFSNYTVPGPEVWSGQNAGGGGVSVTTKKPVVSPVDRFRLVVCLVEIAGDNADNIRQANEHNGNGCAGIALRAVRWTGLDWAEGLRQPVCMYFQQRLLLAVSLKAETLVGRRSEAKKRGGWGVVIRMSID
ncbi:fungal cellulose binding domain-containing protein [Drepanopeziza brunnea f. sp. 'multigermtubi' MB_m1]|uniref:AA9 family lytic polysaccharide monooxygenase n=1 Tax=Marssonina brunnea f. sp. multigermtubi (strain MB_m1) TaxID=1072389 RepID=K1XHQ6_MARBU|nr:fungal cellulose binding domain-containing protein [Drepanopeziza brunnea f. sp. 'multigermtubi' MB_m1]EKD20293.1 fungal cellulose binding domain-containing protein [Drepanopeziza brunnea f. sp. 'multigermtubi' MB_m1]